MRSIRYFGNGTLKMVEAPEPEIKRADEVKIRVAYCGVCAPICISSVRSWTSCLKETRVPPSATRRPA